MISSRFPAISCERMPSPPRLVSTFSDLLYGSTDVTFLLYPGEFRLNVGNDAERLSDPDGLLAEALRLVTLDVPPVRFDLAPGALLAPAQVLYGYPGGCLVHVEAHRGAEPDHRAPEQHIGEGLGQLMMEGVEDLGAQEAGLDGGGRAEGHPQRGVVAGQRQHVGRTRAVEFEKPLGELVGQAALHLELRGEGVEVPYGAARERDSGGADLGGFEAELLVDHINRLAGEVAVGRQLAADNGDQTPHPGHALPDAGTLRADAPALRVVVDDVAPGHASLRPLRLV